MSGFYAGKKVIVTGGAGFLGTHLVKMLQEAGAVVFVPRSNVYDLRIGNQVFQMFAKARNDTGSERIDIVFHLAARVSGIASTSKKPAAHLFDNAMMALNLTHSCWMFNAKLIMAGSVCAYPEQMPGTMTEDNLLNGAPEPTNASYGHAKRLALAALQAYHQQHGLRCAYLLSANLYGPGDNFDPATSHVIPALIRKVSEAQARGDAGISVWGSGHASRDFLYVEDAAKAYMLAGEKVDTPDPINIGSGREIFIAGLVEKIKAAMGFQGDTVFDTSRPDGQKRRLLQIDRAKALMGWTPETNFDEGLRRTVEWWKGQQDG
jgi:GDP-L-fucose synthase